MELIDVLPDDVQPGDYMCINDKLTKIVAVYPKGIVVDIDGKKLFVQNAWSRAGVRYKREVDEHPHGLIPDEYGSVIRVDGDIYVKRYSCWLKPLADTYNHHEEMQQLADQRGFDVLWPKPSVEITEEMVETGAREVDPAAWDEGQWQRGGRRGAIPETEGAHAARNEARGTARAVLEAVFGTPGDGSTEHDRDGIGICKRCGEGLTGLAVVDGEAPCSGSTGDA